MLPEIGPIRADQSPAPNQSEAIRLILRDWLIGNGYLKADDDDA